MQIQTKYNIGDTVWAIENNKIINFIVKNIYIDINGEGVCIYYENVNKYTDSPTWLDWILSKKENEIAQSKEELIELL